MGKLVFKEQRQVDKSLSEMIISAMDEWEAQPLIAKNATNEKK